MRDFHVLGCFKFLLWLFQNINLICQLMACDLSRLRDKRMLFIEIFFSFIDNHERHMSTVVIATQVSSSLDRIKADSLILSRRMFRTIENSCKDTPKLHKELKKSRQFVNMLGTMGKMYNFKTSILHKADNNSGCRIKESVLISLNEVYCVPCISVDICHSWFC